MHNVRIGKCPKCRCYNFLPQEGRCFGCGYRAPVAVVFVEAPMESAICLECLIVFNVSYETVVDRAKGRLTVHPLAANICPQCYREWEARILDSDPFAQDFICWV
jgi:hypothetical protein